MFQNFRIKSMFALLDNFIFSPRLRRVEAGSPRSLGEAGNEIIIKRHLIKFIGILLILFLFPLFISARVIGQEAEFFVNSDFDLEDREKIVATLQKITPKLYFYIDKNWWDEIDRHQREETKTNLVLLAEEFENNIYPTLTSVFGYEPKPGIDNDERITILFHSMIERVGGYFNSGDGFLRVRVPTSNEREMIYLNTFHINNPLLKSFLAHEFIHLITFNQKEILQGISEEIWLNDVRAEFVSTLLGYDDVFEGSNLEMRVRKFLNRPHDSLTEWRGTLYDYAAVNLFAQYLVDHYGIEILVDSLHSPKVGIPSINYALKKNGFEQDFHQVFTNWKIAVLINNCEVGPKYCFLNPNLQDFRVTPLLNFLPFVGRGVLSVTSMTKNWAGNWHRFVGGRGILEIEFAGHPEINFKVPYIIEDTVGEFTIGFLEIEAGQEEKGRIIIPNFGREYLSLTILPSAQGKIVNFNGIESSYSFFWSASIENIDEARAEKIRFLLEQIAVLERTIEELTAKIQERLKKRFQELANQRFDSNLYFGMRNNFEVRRLQKFLKLKGPEIYPEGLITGNFFQLTKRAVVRFQEKYAEDILAPLGLERGTGFFGPMTRTKINEILSQI